MLPDIGIDPALGRELKWPAMLDDQAPDLRADDVGLVPAVHRPEDDTGRVACEYALQRLARADNRSPRAVIAPKITPLFGRQLFKLRAAEADIIATEIIERRQLLGRHHHSRL